MARDPEFLADANKVGETNVKATSGEDISRLIAQHLKSDPAVFEAARDLIK